MRTIRDIHSRPEGSQIRADFNVRLKDTGEIANDRRDSLALFPQFASPSTEGV